MNIAKTKISRRTFAAGIIASLPLVLAACNDSKESVKTKSAVEGEKNATDKPVVFASSVVWGSVAKAVGGEYVEVVNAIDNPDQDPHDYEPSARQVADAKKAAIVIFNGGGYDDWAAKLAGENAVVIDAVKVSGLKKEGEEDFNEHVFYSLATAKKVAAKLKDDLSEKNPGSKAEYEKNLEALNQDLDQLLDQAKKFGESHPNLQAVATEPVTGYLLADMGIKDVTPEEFVEQAETEAGASVAAVNETVNLIKGGSVNLLVLNAQTEDKTSETLLKAAEEKKVPVVKVYETFPAGISTYQAFIGQAEDSIQKALA